MRGMGCATVAALFLAAPVAAQNPQDDAAAPQPDAAYAASMAEAAWDWQPGDLIFFHDDNYSTSPASHCGIYVGNHKMLHCGSPIGYADLTDSYWQTHFHSFGRVPN